MHLLLFFWFALVSYSSQQEASKVCETYYDYLWRDTSDRCHYDENLKKRMPDLVTQHNIPAEPYEVTTVDGYMLTMFRMEQKQRQPKGVVFLMHGASAACDVWVDKGNASLAISLYYEGFEVWLGNARGTPYSRKHVTLNPDSDAVYWDYSFHEMGLYDLPAQITMIKNVSKAEKVAYVGHSMGGTMAVIYASVHPEHAKQNINAFILFSPAIYLNHTSAMTKHTAEYREEIYLVATFFHQNEIMNHDSRLISFFSNLCSNTALGMFLCSAYIEYRAGVNLGEMHSPYLAEMFSHNPNGLSIKIPVHYFQIVSSGIFRPFDHGTKRNIAMYGKEMPDPYPVENITAPMHIMAGAYDEIVNYKDLESFYNKLNNQSIHEFEVLPFNHIDCLYGKDIEIFVNTKVKQVLKQCKFFDT